MDFERVDMDNLSEEELQEAFKMNEILFRLNHTMPMTPEYGEVLKELFGDNIGENSMVQAPLSGAALDRLKIGNNVFINSNCLAMARGGITLEDDVMLAANVQLLLMNMTDRFCFASRYISKKEHGLVPVQVFFLV